MADILSQDEINALVESYKATGAAEEAGQAVGRQIRLYDFNRPDKFCKEHLRALNLIHAKHGASLAVALASLLRVDTQVNLLALDQLTYREYCASVPDGTLFAEVGLEPLTSIAVFEFNPALVGACVDLLAGGVAASSATSTKITEIDKAVMRPLVDLALKKYAEAWASSVVFNPRIVAFTTESTTRQVLLPSEGVLICGYEVSIGEQASMMSVCMPAGAIEAILPALTLGNTVNAPVQRADKVSESLKKLFQDVEVECRALLGRTSLSVADVSCLEVGDLIRLPVKTNENAEFWVENVATFAGPLGRSGQNLAIKISTALVGPEAKQ